MADEATATLDKKAKDTGKVSDKAAAKDDVEVVEKKPKRKIKRLVKFGRVYIKAGFNNTLLTATDPDGNVLARSSAGGSGFKGAKKSTPYAAQVAAERLAEKLEQFGMQHVQVFLKGVGPGREQGIRGLAKNFDVDLIVDRTALPHNGCRPKKRRRV
ncbi:MAG: 30S ribosomal protein S11 [Candidatus Gracilibacteria bacterium]|nr:30S ribosomal protein S11 [Candidatus Gracilibacteria bacterium]